MQVLLQYPQSEKPELKVLLAEIKECLLLTVILVDRRKTRVCLVLTSATSPRVEGIALFLFIYNLPEKNGVISLLSFIKGNYPLSP